MMKRTKLLKSKRGIALENAILFLLVIFSFCALLTGMVAIGHAQIKVDAAVLQRDVQIDQIGEDFLTSVRRKEAEFNKNYDNYDYTVEGSVLTVWRNDDTKKTVLLYVDAKKVDDTLTVTAWRYSAP